MIDVGSRTFPNCFGPVRQALIALGNLTSNKNLHPSTRVRTKTHFREWAFKPTLVRFGQTRYTHRQGAITMPTSLELRTRPVGPYSVNAYALVCPVTRQSVLIDPGDDPDALQEMLKETRPIAILLTHTHFDHVGALKAMRARLKVSLLLHRGPHAKGFMTEANHWVEDGDTLQVGEQTLRVFSAPGHTADQVCYAIRRRITRYRGRCDL